MFVFWQQKKDKLKQAYIIFILFLLSLAAVAQDLPDTVAFKPVFKKDHYYKIKTRAGTTHTGKVVKENASAIVVSNEQTRDSLQINKKEISYFQILDRRINNKQQPKEEEQEQNPHAGTYMLSSSAFETQNGEAVANNHWILLQNLQYSLNENVSVTTNVLGINPISFGLKTQFRLKDRVFVGASASAYGSLFSNSGNPVFFGYLAQTYLTFGSTNSNITTGFGLAGLNLSALSSLVTSSAVVSLPFVSGAFCQRINKNFAFVGEGYYFLGATSVVGGVSVKFFNNDYYCWTIGMYTLINEANRSVSIDLKNYFIPYLGIRRKFN